MKIISLRNIKSLAFIAALSVSPFIVKSQTLAWRLANPTYSQVDPDGAGPALGSFTFDLEIRSTGASVSDILAISTGWSYDSTKAKVPNTPGCGISNNPTNVSLNLELTTALFSYGFVNQCIDFTQSAGGNSLNRTVVGTLDGTAGNGITIDGNWKRIFTVTMWTLSTSYPQGGYVAINPSNGGTPLANANSSYAVADLFANEYPVNSETFSTPLAIGAALPVAFSNFNVNCKGNGTLISWATETETNSSHFVIEKSLNGTSWSSIGRLNAAGNSGSRKFYQYLHPEAGKAMFRVKEYDLDGKTTQTEIASSNCGSNNQTVSIFPNPAKDVLKVSLSSQSGERVQLQITDAAGRKLRNKSVELAGGSNQVELNISGLSDGNYLLQVIRSQGAMESIPFIKN